MPAMAVAAAAGATVGQSVVGSGGRGGKVRAQQEQQARTKTNGRKTAFGPAAADAAAGAAAGTARKAAGRVEGGDNRTRSHGRRKGAPAPLQYNLPYTHTYHIIKPFLCFV